MNPFSIATASVGLALQCAGLHGGHISKIRTVEQACNSLEQALHALITDVNVETKTEHEA